MLHERVSSLLVSLISAVVGVEQKGKGKTEAVVSKFLKDNLV